MWYNFILQDISLWGKYVVMHSIILFDSIQGYQWKLAVFHLLKNLQLPSVKILGEQPFLDGFLVTAT